MLTPTCPRSAERELLGDLVLLKEDLERLRDEEDADLSLAESISPSRAAGRRPSGSFGGNTVRTKPSAGLLTATSGGSDSEGDDDENDDDEHDVDSRKKGAFAKILNDPREYAEASRAGRKSARRSSVDHAQAQAQKKGKAKVPGRRRSRALSSASETGDLLGLDEDEGAAEEAIEEDDEDADEEESRSRAGGAQQPARAGFVRSGGGGSRPRLSSKRGMSRMSNSLLTTEEEGLMSGAAGGAVWEGLSDWAIDTRIMYKRRLASLFTVRPSPLFVRLSSPGPPTRS